MRKHSKWMRWGLLTAAAAMIASVPVMAEEAATEPVQEQTEMDTESVQNLGDGETAVLSDALYDFQIQIDGNVYQFPMAYDAFIQNGWELDTDYSSETEELEPNQYGLYYFVKDGVECTGYVINLGINNQPVTECLVGGISIDSYYWDVNTGEVLMARGIQRGVSTLDDILAAYGNPTDTYEGDTYTSVTYDKDSFCDVELTVGAESGVLEGIDMQNFVAPEGFDVGEASDEVPEEIAAYQAPTELGDDLLSYRVELDGALYQLPCPVSALLENGWTIDENNSDEVISAGSFGWVDFVKEGYSFSEMVSNDADYATSPENCWVESLNAGDYGMEAEMNLPGGYSIGMSESDLVAALDGSGIPYEVEDDGSYRYYQLGEDMWNMVCFYVYTDEESDIHPLNTVYKIEVSRENQ